MTPRTPGISRREMIRRLMAMGLTAASASSLAAAWGTRAMAQPRYRLSFANVTEAGELFVQLGDGIVAAAETANIELRRYDNNFDGETALRNAQLMVQDNPDLILEYNGVEGIGPALQRIFERAGIPFIAINVPVPGGHWFNLVNRDIGADTARTVVPMAMEKGWTADNTTVLIIQSAQSGEEVNDCIRYFYTTAAEMIPGMTQVAPSEITALTTSIGAHGIQVDGEGVLETSYTAVRNVLQTLPQDRNILLYSINDDSVLGGWRAISESGRAENALVAGLGGSVAALEQLRTNPQWVAEGSIFFTKWGQYLVAMAVAILEGATPPSLTKSPQIVLTADTVDEFYDSSGEVLLLPPLDETNQYLADTGILQLFGNVQGLT